MRRFVLMGVSLLSMTSMGVAGQHSHTNQVSLNTATQQTFQLQSQGHAQSVVGGSAAAVGGIHSLNAGSQSFLAGGGLANSTSFAGAMSRGNGSASGSIRSSSNVTVTNSSVSN